MNCEKPLPEHTSLNYDECYAKIVLEKVVSESFQNLIIKDKPDLQSSDGSKGIEVTCAIAQDQMNAEKLYSKMKSGLVRNEEGAKKTIKECGCTVEKEILIGTGTDSFKLVLDALEKKLKIINQGGYATFNEYDLFISSDISSDDKMRQEALKSMVEISKEYKISFNQIIVLVPDELCLFNLKTKEYQVKKIAGTMQREMACSARKMVKDNMHDKQ